MATAVPGHSPACPMGTGSLGRAFITANSWEGSRHCLTQQRARGHGAGGVLGVGGVFSPFNALENRRMEYVASSIHRDGSNTQVCSWFYSRFPCTSQLYGFSNSSQLGFLLASF